MSTCDNCCAGFQSNCDVTERTQNPTISALEGCTARKRYFGTEGNEYPCMMPVKFGPDPGTVVPAPDGVDSFGIVFGTRMGEDGQMSVVVQMSEKIVVCWRDMAAATGADPADPVAWWPVHMEMLMHSQILVEFA